MTELKKIVVDSFPIDRLPEELRSLFGEHGRVRITLEQSNGASPAAVPPFGFAAGTYAAEGLDPAEFIRRQRDEWSS